MKLFKVIFKTRDDRIIPVFSCKKYQNKKEIWPSYYFFPYLRDDLFQKIIDCNPAIKTHISIHLTGKQLHLKLPNNQYLFKKEFNHSVNRRPKNIFFISLNKINDQKKPIKNFLKGTLTANGYQDIVFNVEDKCCLKIFAIPSNTKLTEYPTIKNYRKIKLVKDNPLSFILTIEDIFDPEKENKK